MSKKNNPHGPVAILLNSIIMFISEILHNDDVSIMPMQPKLFNVNEEEKTATFKVSNDWIKDLTNTDSESKYYIIKISKNAIDRVTKI